MQALSLVLSFSLISSMIFVSACTKQESPKVNEVVKVAVSNEPERVEVQHVLIGFSGSIPGKDKLTRSEADARELANKILGEARGPDRSFNDLVKMYSDDQALGDRPGVYKITNLKIEPGRGEFSRSDLVKGFGDASFSMQVNEVKLVPYDRSDSPFGFHIIKRLK